MGFPFALRRETLPVVEEQIRRKIFSLQSLAAILSACELRASARQAMELFNINTEDDLRRASIEPYAWVLNKSVLAAGTQDPLLAARLAGERKQMDRMAAGLAKRTFIVPWLTRPPIGFVELSKLVSPASRLEAAPKLVGQAVV